MGWISMIKCVSVTIIFNSKMQQIYPRCHAALNGVVDLFRFTISIVCNCYISVFLYFLETKSTKSLLLRRSFNRSKFTFEATRSKRCLAPRSANAPCSGSTLPDARDRLIKTSYRSVCTPFQFQIKFQI